MRLVSQDGTYDFPYEHVVVYRNETSVVCGIMPDIREKVLLGKYNSKAKAIKVMEMLRDAFAGKFVFKNVNLDDSVFELLKEWKSKGVVVKTNDDTQDVQYINNAIFQFPKDEEIEI